MKKKVTRSLVGLLVFLFLWINLPRGAFFALRSIAIKPFCLPSSEPNETQALRMEVRRLRSQLEKAIRWIQEEKSVLDCLTMPQKERAKFLEKRKYLCSLLRREAIALPAEVIFRSPNFWSSSFWVNVGERDNQALGFRLVGKNSPVLSKGALVGVVEEVFEEKSLVRLITDSSTFLSVRAYRGSMEACEMGKLLQNLLFYLEKKENLFSSVEEKKRCLEELSKVRKNRTFDEEGFWAKGELHGSGFSLWRSRGQTLKGIGFNYCFGDEEGGPYPLSDAIVREKDLLITTGMDGIFPKGIPVATVIKIHPLPKTGYSYELEADPIAKNIDELEYVSILAPL